MNDFWLLSQGAFNAMVRLMGTADIMAAQAAAPPEPVDSDMVIEGSVARIPITGIMTKESSGFMSFLFGHATSYNGIIKAVAEAENDPHVESVLFDPVDGPGGHVNGAFEAAKAIRNMTKPSKAIIRGEAASATYLIASQADEVIVQNEADRIGSIGVVTERTISDERVVITSRNAPLKRPDANTSEGVSAIQDELDMVAEHMVKSIAKGRGITVDIVNQDFGKGSTMTADRALRMGMVDSIGLEAVTLDPQNSDNKNNSALKQKGNGGTKMDLATLLGQPDNSAAKTQYDADMKAARESGIKAEHERVSAHLAFAATSPAEVMKAITEKAEFTQASSATYLAAGMKVNQAVGAVDEAAAALKTPATGADADAGALALAGAAMDKVTDDAISSLADAGSSCIMQ